MRLPAVTLLFLLSSCAKASTPAPAPAADAALDPAAEAPSSVPDAALPLRFSVAYFTKAPSIDECIDVFVDFHGDTTKTTDKLAQAFVSAKPGATRLAKPCGEQFGTDSALAICRMSFSPERPADAGGGKEADVKMFSRYYSLDTLSGSDAYIKECLEQGGDWTAAPHDSAAYLDALRARAHRNVEKLEKRLEH